MYKFIVCFEEIPSLTLGVIVSRSHLVDAHRRIVPGVLHNTRKAAGALRADDGSVQS